MTARGWTVEGTAHGSEILEVGFPSQSDAQLYASSVLDGDTDGWVEIYPDRRADFLRVTDSIGRGTR